MKNPKLKAPSYKIISSAATSYSGNSLTLINLGNNTTIKAIEKDEIIATGTINSSNIECKSLESLNPGVSEIYVIISGQNYTGSVSLTINSDITSEPIVINEEDCYNIYSLYYGQNFESLSSENDFCITENIIASLVENETYGKYIQSNSDTKKSGKFYSIEDLNIPLNGSYILEFDAAIANINSSSSSSSFFILTEESNIDSYLLKMTSNTYNNDKNNMIWVINDSDKTIELSIGFSHYKLIIDRITNKISLSIYSLEDKVILNKEIINKSSSSNSDIAKCFYMSLPRGSRGTIKLNNISVYSYENAQINIPFTEREIIISLNSELKLIIEGVNKSIYCEASFEDTEITIKSKRPGKTYMYFNGILKINDNKALILIIIDIDERGFITYDDEKIYYFSTDINYNKIPSTIQKEYHTDSSIDDLDNSEPEDNPNIKPFVNVEEVNSKFTQFESEALIKPKVKVAFCITINKWCILYTTDLEITEYSEYFLYEDSYDGLLDCINSSFNLLTSGRTNKEKISIITSGSTNTASKNTKSIVHYNNRMNSSVAINCKSYVILDFENNYIYIDNSEKYINDTKEYSILCFIDMERGVKYVTICNINLMGQHTYGVFAAQSYYILFQNFNILIAQGEHSSGSIGIRAQSQANAICNVELNKWSHDLYFDNCSFNGLGEHGIETFNAYNIYGTTIKITDVGGCGVLLNCSYDAWINKVIGIRCCSSGTYAAVRFANDCGPNINIHYVYGEATGNGVFLVSSSNDIHIDKINLINIHSTPIYVGGSAGLHVKSGKIISNGGLIKYHTYQGEDGTKNASTGGAIFLVGGSSSQFLPQWNNIFENIKIEGFDTGYTERYKMSSNYNIYNNIDTTGCKTIKSGAKDGTGTIQDVPFGFCVIDGLKGPGNEQISGEKIISGNYIYALNEDNNSYIIMEYSGLDSVIIIPKKFKGKAISRIGSFAFYGNKNIISVTIDNNIKSLGGLSFGNCTNLRNLKFMNGGSYEIGHCAFRGCEKLNNVDLTDVKILRASCFAWCKNLNKLICPKSVVYFGVNCFYNDNIDLTIECDNINLMTVEPYAFYFIGFNSKINFTGINAPTNLIGVKATGDGSYYYNSHSYVEEKCYKEGVWCKYYYHVAVTPTFKE